MNITDLLFGGSSGGGMAPMSSISPPNSPFARPGGDMSSLIGRLMGSMGQGGIGFNGGGGMSGGGGSATDPWAASRALAGVSGPGPSMGDSSAMGMNPMNGMNGMNGMDMNSLLMMLMGHGGMGGMGGMGGTAPMGSIAGSTMPQYAAYGGGSSAMASPSWLPNFASMLARVPR